MPVATYVKLENGTLELKYTIPTYNELQTAILDKVTLTTLNIELAKKQDKLVSGTNIKTVNSNSLLGSGDLVLSECTIIDLTGGL